MIMALKWLQRRIDLIQSTNPKSFVIKTRKEDPYSVFSSDSAETKDHYLILLWRIKTCKILSNWSINFELRSILLELKTQNGSLLVQIWLLGPPNCHDRLVWTELWGESLLFIAMLLALQVKLGPTDIVFPASTQPNPSSKWISDTFASFRSPGMWQSSGTRSQIYSW